MEYLNASTLMALTVRPEKEQAWSVFFVGHLLMSATSGKYETRFTIPEFARGTTTAICKHAGIKVNSGGPEWVFNWAEGDFCSIGRTLSDLFHHNTLQRMQCLYNKAERADPRDHLRKEVLEDFQHASAIADTVRNGMASQLVVKKTTLVDSDDKEYREALREVQSYHSGQSNSLMICQECGRCKFDHYDPTGEKCDTSPKGPFRLQFKTCGAMFTIAQLKKCYFCQEERPTHIGRACPMKRVNAPPTQSKCPTP